MVNTQILDEAAEWLVTLREDAIDAATREEFAAWLCRSPEHVRAYLELTSVWAEAASPDVQRAVDAAALITRAKAEGNVVAIEDVVPAVRPAPQPRRLRRSAGFLAASFVFVLLAAAAWWQLDRAGTYATGIGEQRSIALEDGSRIELNALSRVRVRYSQGERRVDLLEGQGLFVVAKDAQRPFVVHSGDARVRAVGTQFDVYRKKSGTVVTVLEGTVEVRREAGAVLISEQTIASPLMPVVKVAAGEQTTVAAENVAPPKSADVAAVTAWTQRRLVFESATLSDVAREFNRYNQRQLVVRGAQAEVFLVSGVFSSADPSALLHFLREQPGVIVEETDEEIRIAVE